MAISIKKSNHNNFLLYTCFIEKWNNSQTLPKKMNTDRVWVEQPNKTLEVHLIAVDKKAKELHKKAVADGATNTLDPLNWLANEDKMRSAGHFFLSVSRRCCFRYNINSLWRIWFSVGLKEKERFTSSSMKVHEYTIIIMLIITAHII